MTNKIILPLLIILNAIVFLSQLWPKEAPGFALIIIIGVLVLGLVYFIISLKAVPIKSRQHSKFKGE